MNPHHGFWEKCELDVGDDSHFLENPTLDWAETYHGCSSCCYAFLVQISWGSNSWFVIYPQIKFFIFVCLRNINVNRKWASTVAPPPNWIICHVLMQKKSCHLSWKHPSPPNWGHIMYSCLKTLHGRKQVLICTSILQYTVTKIITNKNDHFSSVVYGRTVSK